MAFNRKGKVQAQARSPVSTASTPSGTTFEGHPGFARDPKSELFLLASNQFMLQGSFYEQAQARGNRLVNLVHQVAVDDPVWLLRLAQWLRQEGNLRSVAIVVGLEGAKALVDLSDQKFGELDRKFHTNRFNKADVVQGAGLNPKYGQGIARRLAKAGIQRPDEPGEAIAYWFSKHGRHVPQPVKKAIADMAQRLYDQRALLKYDTGSHEFRFADVIELTHPEPVSPEQSELFRYALDRRHDRFHDVTGLPMIRRNSLLRTEATEDPGVLLDESRLHGAGMTWEDVLPLTHWLPKKEVWGAIIPSMGYMALLRNLRNFDQAGVSDRVAKKVADRLSDPQQVARSRQLPFRFLSAYRNAPSLRWAWALEQAINHCLANVPVLTRRTLILVDTSGSMGAPMSEHGNIHRWDIAALFGIALATRAQLADVVSFSGGGYLHQLPDRSTPYRRFDLTAGESVLSACWRWERDGYHLNGGTDTAGALRGNLEAHHKRVIIVTDEQAAGHTARANPRYGRRFQELHYLARVNQVVPAEVPLHVINVVGDEKGMMPSGQDNRHAYGGLTDAMFHMIPRVEAGINGQWPWEGDGNGAASA